MTKSRNREDIIRQAKNILIVSAVLFFILRLKFGGNGLDDKVRLDSVTYSPFGYLNWKHADKTDMQTHYNSFRAAYASSKDSFSYTYSNYMNTGCFVVALEASYQETRKFPSNLSDKALNRAFFEMIRSASNGMEQMQGSFPYAILPSVRNSSFRSGDVVGDYVSFLQVIGEMDTDSLQNYCKRSDVFAQIEWKNQDSLNTSEKENWADFEKRLERDRFGLYLQYYSFIDSVPVSRLVNTAQTRDVLPLNFRQEYQVDRYGALYQTASWVFGIPVLVAIAVAWMKKRRYYEEHPDEEPLNELNPGEIILQIIAFALIAFTISFLALCLLG